MRKNITDRTLKALKPGDEIMDSVVPSFGVRVSGTKKSFVVVKRFPGSSNPTRRTLGAYGEITLEQARNKARSWLETIGRGSGSIQGRRAAAAGRYRGGAGQTGSHLRVRIFPPMSPAKHRNSKQAEPLRTNSGVYVRHGCSGP